MGRYAIIHSIKKNGKNWTIFGIILLLLTFVLLESQYGSIWVISEEPLISVVILAGLMGLWGLYLIIFGIKAIIWPEKSRALKKNPLLLQMADELYNDIVYQDEFIICSNRIIANANKPTEMTFSDEVFQIYVEESLLRLQIIRKNLILKTARGRIAINVLHVRQAIIDQLKLLIRNRCRYSFLGNNSESRKYYKKMKKLWQENEAKKTGEH